MPAGTSRFLPTEADTLALGAALAPYLRGGMVVFLSGELGSGKTTFVRAVLRGLGHEGPVKSPTFTLVEPYEVSRIYLYHFDFYRINDPTEIDEAGFRDCFRPDAICLVEWPEKAAGLLPRPDLHVKLRFAGSGREVELSPETEVGRLCLEGLHR